MSASLSPSQQRAALAVAQTLLPATTSLPGGDARSVEAAARFAADASPRAAAVFGSMCQLLDHAAVLSTGKRLRALDAEAAEALLQRWHGQRGMHDVLYLVAFLFKASHFDHEPTYRALDVLYRRGGPPEPARWLAQVFAPDQVENEEIECDVVVMGTGAGGAVVGKELAERGFATVFVEEGPLHRRDAFRGSSMEAKRTFYRGKASIAAVGNAVIPTFMGKLVGGSTAINTGTCFRTPSFTLEKWCEQIGSDFMSPDHFAPHFERVEQTLQVEDVKPDLLGGLSRVVARGCDALGYQHAPMRRNAPDCDAQGVCDFGCPSAARRSTDISYIPPALNRGAVLFTEMRVRRVLIEAGRAVGVEATSTDGHKTLRVRARAVVLAGGAIPTPMFLLEQGLCNSSGQVGRNLSVHPACSVAAKFDERIDGHDAIPQTIYSSEFLREGILLNAANTPISVAPLILPFVGRPLMKAVEEVAHVANLGVMIGDDSRGRVTRGSDGAPRLRYFMSKRDAKLLKKGLIHASEIFFAAGAKEVYPAVSSQPILQRAGGLARLRDMRIRPRDMLLTSYHPLGTCRIGRDPNESVVGLDHQTHDVTGLYIVDGSTVPGPPTVNPQITIMAMATRAAGLIAEQL